ncbi:MAG: MFS transporter [Nitrococcus mobilis]|nr:MFS transporter [Nitrococcus mobilis]
MVADSAGSAATPYWRLAAFYFFFFAVVGGLVPYWGAYLRSLGFGAAAIGELIAILYATKIIAPNIWGWLADRSRRRMATVRLACLMAAVAFAGMLFGRSYGWLALLMALFGFFWNAALPQFEANTMNHLGANDHHYSRIRLWGSMGFIAAVTGLGELTDRMGLQVVPGALLVLVTALAGASLVAPSASAQLSGASHEPFRRVLLRPNVVGFLAACYLLQASHGPFYVFYSIYLADHGYSGAAIGALWAVGVLAEIMVFLKMHRWLPQFGPRRLMTAALALAVVRWTLVGAFPDWILLQSVAQLLHAGTFGVYHAVAIVLINRFFTGPNQGRGQALYSSLTFGAGVASGSLASGYLWSTFGEAPTWYVAAALAATGAVLVARSLPQGRWAVSLPSQRSV